MSAALNLLGGAGTGSAELLFLLFWGESLEENLLEETLEENFCFCG